jgi:ABC-type lipoprotein export system ATPase subunit
MKTYNKGSEWRKWDLHVHTPESGMSNQFGDWDEYVKTLFLTAIKQEVVVLGITDYFTIDGYKKLKTEYLSNDVKLKELFPDCEQRERIKNIRIFPNIEFRLKTIIGKHRINYHVIFSDEVAIQDIEENFLHDIEFAYENEPFETQDKSKLKKNNLIEFGRKIKTEQATFKGAPFEIGCTTAVVDDSQIIKILTTKKEKFKNKYIIVIPVDEDLSSISWNGQDHNVRKGYIQQTNAFFATNENTIQFAQGKKHPTISDYIKEFKSIKPCFSGCDAHSCAEIEKWLGQHVKIFNSTNLNKIDVEKKITWIKADPTFEGLKQTLNEVDRVCIKEISPIKTKIQNNRTKYIKKIRINQIDSYDGKYGKWFQNVEIPLNPELVAIIGHKGSGKSALADIIALCGNYKNQTDFSFLNKNKFRDSRHAKNFEATITWENDHENKKILDDNSLNGEVELIKYLPQGYFERLTNEISSVQEFQKEIENVVFTHLEDDKKVGSNSFEELINNKKELVNHQIVILKEQLSLINKSIFDKEKKLNPIYQANIEAQIQKKKSELDALIGPIEVKNPNEDPEIAEKNKIINEKIAKITLSIKTIEDEITTLSGQKKELLTGINNLKELKQKIKNREDEILIFKESIKDDLYKYQIDVNDIVTFKFDYTNINTILSNKEVELKKIKIKLGEELVSDSDFKSLNKQLLDNKDELKTIQETLDEPAKKYQNYLTDKKTWEENKSLIIGNDSVVGSLSYFEKELKFITHELEIEIQQDRIQRYGIVKLIHNQMKTVLDIYRDVKSKIDSIIAENNNSFNQYKINIEASFSFKPDFQRKFLNFVSQNKSGTFYGKENGEHQINKITESIHFDEYEQIQSLLSNIIDSFFEDRRSDNKTKTFIENQVDDVVGLYDYLFSLEFLDYNYQLRQGNKNLTQLSPGEKGALLLIFYLLLDNNDIPLIIDQPEDNLDNDSVANILVPFIKQAKAKRQIIMVTHNPNLAVVADAEHVIYVELDKENENLFSFKSGSIENREINDCIVKVLEGAMPAFNKRKQKYYE